MPSKKHPPTLTKLETSPDNPLFLSKAFTLVAKDRKHERKDRHSFKEIILEEYDELSKRVQRSKIQEPAAVRNVLRTRRLANFLIDDEGELKLSVLPDVIAFLSEHLYSLGPDRQYDTKRQEQMLNALHLLANRKDLQIALKKIGKPYSHKFADQIIRDTLELSPETVITDAHARRAVLSSWLCLLRQSVGSCFGTAPAQLIHDEQPARYLQDLNELLGTGRLKRTFGGVEYSVPLSFSWGAGDLKRPILVIRKEHSFDPELWLSPALMASLEAVGVIEHAHSLKERVRQLRDLILPLFEKGSTNHPYFVVTVEEIIRNLLLAHLNLTKGDLQEYAQRAKPMFQMGLIMQMSTPAKGGKAELCEKYYRELNRAYSVFKSLADNALLKSWEFTIASFAETKSVFTRWNLYSSLGFNPQDGGGIGPVLYHIIKQKIDESNRKVQEFQTEYEQAYGQIKYLEGRIKMASTEQETQWLKAEYQSRVNEFYFMEEMRNKMHNHGQRIADLYDLLIDRYYNLFPEYFQEVYDADMHNVDVGPYDDSPAGFSLLYKHGRANTSQWTRITDPNEFIEALAAFFVATESQMAFTPDFAGLEQDLGEIVTAVVNHIRTPEFLESAFYRMASAHNAPIVKNPLENLEKIDKKPWSYTSGGTMNNLVSCYFRREQKITEVTRWVENDTELLVFLIDTMKQMAPRVAIEFEKDPKKSLLMTSPTHAFLLKPGSSTFKNLWMNDAYTYTWLRDNVIIPAQRFLEEIALDEEMMQYLIKCLSVDIPQDFHHHFHNVFSRFYYTMNPIEFRNHLIETMQHDKGLRIVVQNFLTPDVIDSFLYSVLPLVKRGQHRESVQAILTRLPNLDSGFVARAMACYDECALHAYSENLSGADALQDCVRAILCLTLWETTTKDDYHLMVANAARESRLAVNVPIIMADTNWVRDEFGFGVNPGTGRFEFWRFDYTGRVGSPMSAWRQWLNGSRQDIPWSVYVHPHEYTERV